ncbi:serine/threonine-protein kinase [Actinophytocola sp.]|uniref:serine/threonine-protein kinase n=1 Tax=Actinophytocola sp. TaxID=1872138 RepID=UPI00389ABCA9
MTAEQTQPSGEERLLDGRYRLGALLGRGGAATVYEAVDIVLGRAVAVKMYQPGSNAVGLYRFAAEARLLAALSHPGLVTVYDVRLEGEQPYLVMHLVNGPTLRDLLDLGPLEPAAVARLGVRLAEVLAYVHAQDVVHRDIKPSNVLVDEAGAWYLADFGIARALSATHLTVTGEFVGTAAYLAPEQVTDVDAGPPVDIYALGLLLLECLTGRTEYTGTTVESALARLARPPRVPDTLPQSWQTLLADMTAQDPAARPDADRCAHLLATIAEQPAAALVTAPTPAPPVPEPAHTATVRSRRSRAVRLLRPAPAALSVAALAAAVVVATAMTSSTAVPGQPGSGSHHTRAPAAGDATPSARGGDEQNVPAVDADGPATPTGRTPNTAAPPGGAPPPAQPGVTEPPAHPSGPGAGPGSNKGVGNGAGNNDKGKGKGKG